MALVMTLYCVSGDKHDALSVSFEGAEDEWNSLVTDFSLPQRVSTCARLR